jgi:FkbM family methyltransferase
MPISRLRAAKSFALRSLSLLAPRFALLARGLRSPYRFSFRQLWVPDPYAGWTAPEVEVVGRDGDLLRLKIGGLHFFWPAEFDTSDLPWLYCEVFSPAEGNSHAYEYGQVGIRSGEWVIDGGAGEGFFTAHALARHANVLAVEPIEELCRALARTFEKEIRQGRVRILQGCLGKRDGSAMLKQKPSVCFSHMAENGTNSVKMHSIDAIVSGGLVPEVGFVKMDVEGAEVDALAGGVRTLRAFKPRLAIAVYHQLDNAAHAKRVVLGARGDYIVEFRGMYTWDDCVPRPYMLFAC